MISPPEEVDKAGLFVFFGQNQCTGINKILPPRACAFLTTNPAITYTQLSQGAMRMRGLAKGQRIHMVMTDAQESLMKKALGKEEIDSVDCSLFAKLVEAKKEAEDNLLSVRQQMRQIVIGAIEDYLDNIPIAALKSSAHKALSQLLATKTSLDPVVEFSSVDSILDLKSALETFAQQTLQGLEVWHKEYGADVVREHAALISPKALNEKLISLVNDMGTKRGYFKERVMVAALPDQGSEVAVSREKQTKTEREQKTEHEVDQNVGGSFSSASMGPVIDLEGLASRATVELKRFQKRFYDDCPENALKKEILVCRLNEAIDAPGLFSPHLYLSDRFATTVLDYRPFEGGYKPPSVCLIERSRSDPSQVNMILISLSEASKIEQKLRSVFEFPFEYCLYYPKTEYAFPQALTGLEENRSFQRLCLEYLVLSGTTYIPLKYRSLLKSWLETIPDLEAFERFYFKAMAREPEVLKSYPTSYLKTSIEIEKVRRAQLHVQGS